MRAAAILGIASLAAGVFGCAGLFAAREPAPGGRLPRDVRPLGYALSLEIHPDRDSFRGDVAIEIELDRSRRTLWLHARDLAVDAAWVEPTPSPGPGGRAGPERVEARFEPADPSGVAALRLSRALAPGRAVIHLAWRAPFDETLRGLFRVRVDGADYAFSQLEPIDARRVFPCFDEPSFKAPFDVALTVPADAVAVANAPVVADERLDDGTRRVHFARTPPLPTYLVAFAVGPFDVVAAPPIPARPPHERPLPFRGVAVRGRGPDLAYALGRTPPLLADLETYFAIPYPFAKLDVIAVPDLAFGAMEHPGAITFRDQLLLVDERESSEDQRRGFHLVMAHELAHMWLGDLVTLAWWDDLWLNEAFATWLSYRTLERAVPEQGAELSRVEAVHWAMDVDALASARSIRQPIASTHDILNAFDSITYQKGGGVLAMFEHWLGDGTFRDGVRGFVDAHRHATATTDDLLAALSTAAGRDVTGPLRSLLDQPGVPLLEVESDCDGAPALRVRQSRYLPLGSRAQRGALWQVPLCVRFGVGGETHEACALVSEREARIPLEADACPDWVAPNADADGYYRWSLAAADAARLQDAGWDALSPSERLSFASNLEAAFRAGTQAPSAVFGALPRLADDPVRSVARAPMGLLDLAREQLADDATRPAVEAYGRELYAPLFARLGWDAAPGADGETLLLRKAVARFLALVARDPAVRAEARRRGLRWAGLDGRGPADARAVDPEITEVVLAVAVQEGDAAVFDALEERLHATQDSLRRGWLLDALAHASDPALAARARELSLDPRLRISEVTAPLWIQSARRATRDAAWRFTTAHFDALVERLGEAQAGVLPWLAADFCDASRAAEVEAFFAPRIEALSGGPRNLASALERIRLCAALVEAQGAPTRDYFRSLREGTSHRGAARGQPQAGRAGRPALPADNPPG